MNVNFSYCHSLVITECRINSYSLLFSWSLRLLVTEASNLWNEATNYGQFRFSFPAPRQLASPLKSGAALMHSFQTPAGTSITRPTIVTGKLLGKTKSPAIRHAPWLRTKAKWAGRGIHDYERCDFHPATSTFSRPNRRGFLLEVGKRRCAYSGAPALLPSILYTGWIKFRQSHNCDSPRKENGLVDRLRHLAAQTFCH